MTKTNTNKPQGVTPATKKKPEALYVKLGAMTAGIFTDATTGAARLEVAPPWGPEIVDELAELGVIVEWNQFDMDTGFGARSGAIPADKIAAVKNVLAGFARHIYA